MSVVVRLAVGALAVYQHVVSPLLPAACRFAPSCSEYARIALVEHGAFTGFRLAVARLLRCHPFHPGGWDPPPAKRSSV